MVHTFGRIDSARMARSYIMAIDIWYGVVCPVDANTCGACRQILHLAFKPEISVFFPIFYILSYYMYDALCELDAGRLRCCPWTPGTLFYSHSSVVSDGNCSPVLRQKV